MRQLSRHKCALMTCVAIVSLMAAAAQSQAQDVQVNSNGTIESVLVTADKRTEQLSDVPASITAFTGDQLESAKITSLADLAAFTPGMTVQDGGSPGQRTVVLRGLATQSSTTTSAALVGTYIDDEPVGGTTAGARGSQYGIDLMPYDLERIEVLKGPQGTIYGADAMGGIVKYVLKRPDLDSFEARAGADAFGVDNGDAVGRNFRGSMNIPIIAGQLAVRISGFDQFNPGYLDNVGTEINNANHSSQAGGRLTALWQATDKLSFQGTVMLEQIHAGDSTGVNYDTATNQPVYGFDTRLSYFPETYTQQLSDFSLRTIWDMDFASLTSSTSYSKILGDRHQDLTAPAYTSFYDPNALTDNYFRDSLGKFTEEVRLASPDSDRLQWLVGGMWTEERPQETGHWLSYTAAHVPSQDPLYPELPNLLSDPSRLPNDFQEYAAFGNATFKFNDRFDITGGVRYATNKQYSCQLVTGVYASFTPGQDGVLNCSNRPFQDNVTWMANARMHIDDNQMFYVTVATGYRPGGGCTGCGNPALHIPDFYYPDNLINYEAGLKGAYFNNTLSVDLSVFNIDWSNIQIQVPNGGFPYSGNGSSAVSQGAELSAFYVATPEITINVSSAFTDAHLTADAPAISGNAGDQLPLSTRFMAAIGIDYKKQIDEGLSVVVGGSYRYKDKVYNNFAGSGTPDIMGPQNVVDLYGGVDFKSLQAKLYLKNASNDRSFTGLLYSVDPTKPVYVPIQPRTIGISVDYKFDN